MPEIQNVFFIQYTVEVIGTLISMEFDFRFCYSFLNSDWRNRLGQFILRQGLILKDISRNVIPVLGIAKVDDKLNNRYKQFRVVFLDHPDTAFLFKRKWIAQFHLLSVHKSKLKLVLTFLTTLLTKYSDLFDTSALPQIKGFKAHLHINSNSHFKPFKP